MSRENQVNPFRHGAPTMFQSAPGSMSRENEEHEMELGHDDVSIRSRLDEPGERDVVVVGNRPFVFQSAPGSMSRENTVTYTWGAYVNQVSIRSRLDEPGEPDPGRYILVVAAFQSAPGSMSRENASMRSAVTATASFNPLPAR